ncbi:MAG TPA: thiamine phosphate synthase [Holophagaceae bacterium]|jgi:thiamine monophosphate synthase|nr:thiamine phosphate synthase [Holophagaceae bacterium]
MFILAITPGVGFGASKWRAVLRSGVDGFLIREKGMEARALLDAARWCRDEAPGIELWVGGRLDVALAAGCGLHAPEAHPEVPEGLVPVSRPLHEEAQLDSRRGARQLLIAPAFTTPGKGAPWGAARLCRFLEAAPAGPRLLALGGVTAENAAELRHPRLDGVALIRAIWEAPDPRGAVSRLKSAASG